MSAIIIAVIALIAFGLAFHPLFREESFAVVAASGCDPNLENLLSSREATYSAIKDLESDHAQGKLSDADYQTLRGKYEAKALAILQQLDQLEASTATPPQRTAGVDGKCAQCGESYGAHDKFCRRCGTSLATACISCGASVKEGAKFCARCGTPVGVLQPA